MTLHEWTLASRPRYVRRVRKLRRVTAGMSAREVAAFVLCTPRQTYECALRQWRGWQRTGKVRGAMAPTRQRYIDALPRRLRRTRGESVAAWCTRLERIKGLGVAKAAFLASLLEPTTRDVAVCIDVWMMRGLGQPKHRVVQTDAVRATQNVAAFMARQYGMPRFAWQWATWDYFRTRGRDERQEVLVVNETHIERDLR